MERKIRGGIYKQRRLGAFAWQLERFRVIVIPYFQKYNSILVVMRPRGQKFLFTQIRNPYSQMDSRFPFQAPGGFPFFCGLPWPLALLFCPLVVLFISPPPFSPNGFDLL